MPTTSKEEASIKSIKSFDFEQVGAINRLRIISHNKLFDRSTEMENYNVKTWVPELLELSSEQVGLMPEGMQMVEREPSNRLHRGL